MKIRLEKPVAKTLQSCRRQKTKTQTGERETDRETQREKERDRERDRETERDRERGKIGKTQELLNHKLRKH